MDTRIVWHARRLTLPAPQDTPRPISAPARGRHTGSAFLPTRPRSNSFHAHGTGVASGGCA